MCRMKDLFVVAGFVFASVLLLGVPVANADLLNGSFETPDISPATVVSGVPTPWNQTSSSYNHTYRGAQSGLSPLDGQQWIEAGEPGIWQNTGIALQDGTSYTFTVYAMNDAVDTDKVLLRLFAADDTSSRGTAFAEAMSANAPTSWNSYNVSGTYTGPGNQYLTVGLGGDVVGHYLEFDLASVSIPEPSSIILLVSGLIGLLCYAWRRRK